MSAITGTGEVKEIGLLDLSNGAIGEVVNYNLEKILKNIKDPNTDAKSKRSLKITIDFKPTEDRETTGIEVKVESKVSPVKPIASMLILGGTEDEPVAMEYQKQTPGQVNLAGETAPQPNVISFAKRA